MSGHFEWRAVDDGAEPQAMHGTWGGGMPPPRRTIRLFPGWSAWPLWESAVGDWDPGYAMSPDDYGLSEALADRMRAWQDAWEAHLLDNDYHLSPAFEEAAHREGAEIARLLAAEVGAFADVSYEP